MRNDARMTRDRLDTLYNGEKLSMKQIAGLFNCKNTTIANHMTKFNIKRRNHVDAGRLEGDRHIGNRKYNDGYIMVFMPDHPYAMSCGNVLEHRLVLEEKLGRYLDPDEHGHHLNGIKDDNRPENLVAMPKARHNQSLVMNVLQARIRELEQENQMSVPDWF